MRKVFDSFSINHKILSHLLVTRFPDKSVFQQRKNVSNKSSFYICDTQSFFVASPLEHLIEIYYHNVEMRKIE